MSSATCQTFTSPVDLAASDGPADLARLAARHAIATADAGLADFYAWPGGVVIAEDGDIRDLVGEARRQWASWRDRLRSCLGTSVMRRGLRASGTELTDQLTWRGILVTRGIPRPWQAWTPGDRHRRYPRLPAPSWDALRNLAGPVVPIEADQPGEAVMRYSDYETAALGETRLSLYARGDDPATASPLGHALVDRLDGERASRHVWEIDPDGYPVMRGTMGRVRLHDFLVGPSPPGRSWDHISRDKRDNRRGNLRLSDPVAQARNRGVRSDSLSGIKGVSQMPDGPWRLRYREGSKRVAKYFPTREAAEAASRERFGPVPGD